MKFHPTTPNGTQFKTYELVISGIFSVIFSDCGWPHISETAEGEVTAKG